MPFQLIRNDITNMRVDAIVNAANSRLKAGGGVCGAIFERAGFDRMQAACDRIGHCPVGGAAITPGFDLPARYVIHACGPVWQGGGHGEAGLLRNCYVNALKLARDYGLESVAFPLISAGIYGYPKREAMSIAVSAIGECLLEWEMQVYLVIFDGEAFALGERLQASIQAFIDDRYVQRRTAERNRGLELERELQSRFALESMADAPELSPGPLAEPQKKARPMMPRASGGALPTVKRDLERAVSNMGQSFSERLFQLIDARGLTDPQVYKRANLDRKLFSKIRTKPNYTPGKNTVLALCIALRLDIGETEDLLRRAGLALSPGSKADLIVEYFIQNGNYNVFEINEALFAFDQELLGAKA